MDGDPGTEFPGFSDMSPLWDGFPGFDGFGKSPTNTGVSRARLQGGETRFRGPETPVLVVVLPVLTSRDQKNHHFDVPGPEKPPF